VSVHAPAAPGEERDRVRSDFAFHSISDGPKFFLKRGTRLDKLALNVTAEVWDAVLHKEENKLWPSI
jgi:hypothetical protein